MRDRPDDHHPLEGPTTADAFGCRYEMLFSYSRDIILFLDCPEGRILDANLAAVQAYGYSREELLSMCIKDLRADLNARTLQSQISQAFSKGLLFEATHRRKDGSTFPVEVSSKGAFINQKSSLISIIRDITERKQAERSLKKSHENLQKVLAARYDFWKRDALKKKQSEKVLKSSMRHFELLAQTSSQLLRSSDPQEVISSLCRRVMDALDCQCFVNYLKEEETGKLQLNAYAGLAPEQVHPICWMEMDPHEDMRGCVAQDGRMRIVQRPHVKGSPCVFFKEPYSMKAYACFPLPDGDDRILGMLSFGTRNRDVFSSDDIRLMKAVSDLVAVGFVRIKQQWALLKANQRLRSTIESITDAYLAMDYEGRLLEINTVASLRLFGGRDLIGQIAWEIDHNDRNDTFYGNFRTAIETGAPIHFEAYAANVDGWFEVHAYPRDGRLEVYLREITDRKKAEQESKNAHAELERKVLERTAELELRSLQFQALTRKTITAMESDRRVLAKEIHDSIGGTLAAIKHMIEAKSDEIGYSSTDDPFSYSRIIEYLSAAMKETRRMTKQLRPSILDDFGLISAIKEYVKDFQSFFPGITCVLNLSLDESRIPDEVKTVLYRVAQEALNNAGRHSQADRVQVGLFREKDLLCLQINDNGTGFDLGTVLENDTPLAGYGIQGMRERVEICKGSFYLAAAPGTGTSIIVTVPLGQPGAR